MTRSYIITESGTEELSNTEFFTRAFGHAPLTKAEREAKYRAKCEYFADLIEIGNEWAVPPPCLWDARKIVAEREELRLTEVRGDPLLGRAA